MNKDKFIDKWDNKLIGIFFADELNSVIETEVNEAVNSDREQRGKAHEIEIANLQAMLKDKTVKLANEVISNLLKRKRVRGLKK